MAKCYIFCLYPPKKNLQCSTGRLECKKSVWSTLPFRRCSDAPKTILQKTSETEEAAALLRYRINGWSCRKTEGKKANAKYLCGVLSCLPFRQIAGSLKTWLRLNYHPWPLYVQQWGRTDGPGGGLSSGLGVYFSCVRLEMNENSFEDSSLSFSDDRILFTLKVIFSKVLKYIK